MQPTHNAQRTTHNDDDARCVLVGPCSASSTSCPRCGVLCSCHSSRAVMLSSQSLTHSRRLDFSPWHSATHQPREAVHEARSLRIGYVSDPLPPGEASPPSTIKIPGGEGAPGPVTFKAFGVWHPHVFIGNGTDVCHPRHAFGRSAHSVPGRRHLPSVNYRDLTVEVTGSAGSPGSIRPCHAAGPGFLTTTRTQIRVVL